MTGTLLIGTPSPMRDACEALLRERGLPIATLPLPAGAPEVPGPEHGPYIALCTHADSAEEDVRAVVERWPETRVLAILSEIDPELSARLLDAGADDAIPLRAARVQLAPRLDALRRRAAMSAGAEHAGPLVAGGLTIDLGAHRVWSGGAEVALSPTEFRILRKLSVHPGRFVAHQEILLAVWGDLRPELFESLRVYVSGIRRKVRAAGETVSIVTRPGLGYALVVAA